MSTPRGERARMMEDAQSLVSNPQAWYRLMQNQMRNHDDVTKSGWLNDPARTADEIKQHWYAGTLLGFDTMMAADRYIAKLETMVATRTPELMDLPPMRRSIELRERGWWEKWQAPAVAFGVLYAGMVVLIYFLTRR